MQQSSGSYIVTAIVALGCEEINMDMFYGSLWLPLYINGWARVVYK
jgi:hypothetical protein